MGTKMYVDGDDLTSVASAIRTKGGTAASLVFPTGFVSAIGDISTGDPGEDLKTVLENKLIPPYNDGYDLETAATKARTHSFRESNVGYITLTEALSIEDYAFMDAAQLYSVDAPKVTSIGFYAFSGCRFLQKNDKAYQANPVIRFPALLTIGASAFYGCWSMETIELPVVTSIGSSAFQGCSGLTTIVMEDVQSVPSLGNTGAIPSSVTSIYVPDALVASFKTATNWSSFASVIKPISEM